MSVLYFNNVAMPTPAHNGGITIKPEKVWAPKTGRALNGELLGDMVAIKDTIQIKWPPLSQSQIALIDSYLSQPFFTVSFVDPRTGSFSTRTVYAGTPSYPVYNYVFGSKIYQGVAVDLIEK